MKVLFFILIILSIHFAQEYNQSFTEPYKGEIITNGNGYPILSGRIIVGVKTNVTPERVEELIKPFNGKISGWLKNLDEYIIDLPSEKREEAILSLNKESDVDFAEAQRVITFEPIEPAPSIFPGSATICPLGIIIALILLVLLVKKFLLRR